MKNKNMKLYNFIKVKFILMFITTIFLSCEEEPPILSQRSDFFVGSWQGETKTLEDDIKIRLNFENNGNYYYEEISNNTIIYNELGIWQNIFRDENFDNELDVNELQSLEFTVTDSKTLEYIGKVNSVRYELVQNDSTQIVDFQITSRNIIRLTKN